MVSLAVSLQTCSEEKKEKRKNGSSYFYKPFVIPASVWVWLLRTKTIEAPKTESSTPRPTPKPWELTGVNRRLRTGRGSVFKVVFKGDDVNSTYRKWITVKTEQLNGWVQQSCGSDLYAGHIPPISVFLPQLYCFPGNQPQIRTGIKHLSDPQQGRKMGLESTDPLTDLQHVISWKSRPEIQ